MMNLPTGFNARLLSSSLSLCEDRIRALAKQTPQAFRNLILYNPDLLAPLTTALQPWQLRDFEALDPAWTRLARNIAASSRGRVIQRAYIERPRGHSKTTDIAAQITWILLAATRPVTGLAAAADRDQADLIHQAIGRLVAYNQVICRDLQLVQHRVRNATTGSRLDIISSDARSSYGVLPDFVVCDEICHWEKPDLWYSLLSSAAKKPQCVLTVLTNAGVGRGWQWDIREHASTSPDWHFQSLNGPHAPWITDDWLAEQRAMLPEPVFERLWLNIWQHSDGGFISLAEAEACRDVDLEYQWHGRRGVTYIAAIDYAEKHDYTVGCVCHAEGLAVIVDRMDVVKPTPDRLTPIQWVEDWIEDVAARFPQVRFIVDEYQLLGTIQRLGQRFLVDRFAFRGGDGNHRLAMQLRRLILERQLRWYPGCGAVTPSQHRDDLETELASLLLKQSVSGRVRIDHVQDGLHHDDRAFTLGAACLALLDVPSAQVWEVSAPARPGEFAW